jgi:predicted oxidoreductase
LYAGGPDVSSVAWGMWRFRGDDLAEADRRVRTAIDAGVTLFDTADVYGPDNGEAFGAAEALLGAVLRRAPSLKARMVLATKGGIIPGTPYDSSSAYLTSAIDASLARLGVERVDLWQIHRPDMLTHPAEIASAQLKALNAGKIGAIGVSNHRPSQVDALQAHLPTPVVSVQPEFSPLAFEPLFDGVFDQALQRDLAVLAWSPLGGGRLGDPQDARSWIMAHPARPIPIVGAQTPARIAEIPDAYKPRWTRADWYAVLSEALSEPLP